MYSIVSIRPSHLESSTGLSQAPLKRRFPTFHYRNSFSPLEPSKPPPKDSIGSEKPPHTLFFRFRENSLFWREPHFFSHTGNTSHAQKVHSVSKDPDIPHETELGLQQNYL